MGDVMERGCGFVETNRILGWLAGWLAAVGGQSYLPLRIVKRFG
jgi:hypothetical protein